MAIVVMTEAAAIHMRMEIDDMMLAAGGMFG